MRHLLIYAVSALLLVTAASAFAQSSSIHVEQSWARATPGGATTGAVYMTISNKSDVADRLTAMSSELADKAQIHEMKVVNGVMEMREVAAGLPLPAGASVALKPGGYHIMLIGLKHPLKAGDTVPLTLTFEKAGTVAIKVPVETMGAATESMEGMAMPNMPDMSAKAPGTPPWDVSFSGALMSDYNMRGVTMSNHRPSVQAGIEPHYDITPSMQIYAGVSGQSIDMPNQAAAEIDFYGGLRPTFGKLALDFGIWSYNYPGGQCFNAPPFCPGGSAPLANGNVMKADANWLEGYGRATYAVNDYVDLGGAISGSPSVFNMGAYGVYYSGNATLTAPSNWLPNGIGGYLSANIGWWQLGTMDAFYAAPPAFPAGAPLQSYANWDVSVGLTWNGFTLDLGYYDSNLDPSDCNIFTNDQTAAFSPAAVTARNPGGLASKWCGAAFIAKVSASFSVFARSVAMKGMRM